MIISLDIGGTNIRVALNNQNWLKYIVEKISITVEKKINFKFAKNIDGSTLITCAKL